MTGRIPLRALVASLACLVMAGCGQPEPAAPEAASPPESAPVVAPVSTPSPAVAPPAAEEALPAATPPVEAQVTPEPVKAAPPTIAPALPPPVIQATPAAFARCQGCHSVEPGDGHGTGPNLAGVMGARVGSRPGYAYSEAMAGFGQTWTPALMDAFLQNPRETVPGTKMAAAPVRDPALRAEIIAWLSQAR